jgi:hypothetical protein
MLRRLTNTAAVENVARPPKIAVSLKLDGGACWSAFE